MGGFHHDRRISEEDKITRRSQDMQHKVGDKKGNQVQVTGNKIDQTSNIVLSVESFHVTDLTQIVDNLASHVSIHAPDPTVTTALTLS